ncbi:MAG: leucine-rich repeat protein [Lachnospiraceae bacterium]
MRAKYIGKKAAGIFLAGVLCVTSTGVSVPVSAQTSVQALTQTADQQVTVESIQILPYDTHEKHLRYDHHMLMGESCWLQAEIHLSDGTVVRSDDSIEKTKLGSDLEKVKWVMTTKEGKVPASYREETDRNLIKIQSRASHPETLEIRAISLADDTIQSEPYEMHVLEAYTDPTYGTSVGESQAAIKAVRIKVRGIPQDYSTEHSLSLGSTMILEAEVEREDGSLQTADENMATWSVKKKDGEDSAACFVNHGYINSLYAPYGQTEDLIVTVKVGDVTAEHALTTFEEKELNGDSYFRFQLGKVDPKDVSIDAPKETWNPEKKSYQIVLPDVTDLQIYTQGMGKRFLGWKEEATGNVYKGGTIIEREYKGRSYVIFTAQWKDLQKGETFIKDDAMYKVTSDKKGKKEVTFEKLAYQTQSIQPYKIPDTVKYDGITYKVTGIAAHALEKAGLNKITIGKNVTTISAKAFANCKYLKKIVIQSKQLKASGVKKNAFTGISKDVTIQCPKEKAGAYTSLFRKSGLKKNVTIKGK